MTLLEYAEKTSPIPLSACQREFLAMYEQAVKEDKELICFFPPRNGHGMVSNLINGFYGNKEV